MDENFEFEAEVKLKGGNVKGSSSSMVSDKALTADMDEQCVPTMKDMFFHPVILRNFIIIIISYSCVSTNYFMIGFYTKYIEGNVFTLHILGGVSFIASDIAIPIMQRFLGTKGAFATLFGFGAALAAPLLFIDPEGDSLKWMIPVSTFSVRFCMSAAFVLVYSIQAEAFPSLFIPISFGVSSFAGHLVSVAASELAEAPRPIPMVTFTSLSAIAFVVSIFLVIPKNKEDLI